MSCAKPVIMRYEPRWQAEWDGFVRSARNGTFMFERGFMDYHASRFEDSSLLFFDGGRLVALLPAHRTGTSLVSHEGLPFAGFLVNPRTTHREMIAIMDALRGYLRERGIERLVCTPVPACYHEVPLADDVYLLHQMGARCTGMKLAAGFAGPVSPLLGANTRRNLKKTARRFPCEFEECHDVAEFWPHLERFLQEHRNARPVHSMDEMAELKARFPGQIRLFFAKAAGEVVAGEVVFLTGRVQRGQYFFRCRQDSSSFSRRLILWVAALPDCTRPWIDLGTSVDPGTGTIDGPLLCSKEQTGARGTLVQTWAWDLGQGS